ALAVPVAVLLAGVRDRRAVVARIALGVPVRVRLRRIGHGGAVVDQTAHSVAIDVVRRVVRAGITGVADTVSVRVLLRRVRDGRAVVVLADLGGIEGVPRAVTVAVLVVLGVERTRVAGVAERIAVGVQLIGVRD